MSGWLENFVAESNRIEGIHREPTRAEIAAHEAILAAECVTVSSLERFVATVQPGHVIRDKVGLDVRVGSHIAPSGGPGIRGRLEAILSNTVAPWVKHIAYENLHPFTDGNGRSGRVLWLRQMLHGSGRDIAQAQGLGFLHTFYYQTLSAK